MMPFFNNFFKFANNKILSLTALLCPISLEFYVLHPSYTFLLH